MHQFSFRSRISITILVVIGAICFIPPLYSKDFSLLVTDGIIFLVIIIFLFGIRYVIDGQKLKIYYFWGIHQDIDIMTIRKMEPSCCPLSSPAASLKRLAISYNKHDVIYISPRNQEDFIKQIKQINPNIQL